MAAPMMEPRYASCGCNRVPNSVCWGRNGLLCYAACRAIIVSQTQPNLQVRHTVSGHQDRVNCVRWIQHGKDPEDELVSCATDKSLRIWQRSGTELVCKQTLTGHTASVNSVAGISIPAPDGTFSSKPRTLIASASVDSTVRLWERKENEDTFRCIQTLSFGSGFALDVAWTVLPGTSVAMLACGGDDQKVHLLVEEGDQFITVQKLGGHEDWVRSLAFTHTDDGSILLASCAQDCFIRLWRLSPSDLTAATKVKVAELSLEEDIRLKEITFTFKQKDHDYCYAVTLESVLQGHENWIYSVHWQPSVLNEDGSSHQPMCLLSASMDKSMIIWQPEVDSGLWTEQVRVGAVGGNTLGFYGGIWSSDGRTILAHGYHGAFHMWHQQESGAPWQPGVTLGGHFDSAQDVAWDPKNGHYLLSLSVDQTTRLHGYWKAKDYQQSGWHEIARPQVHGYDMQCIAPLGPYAYASGADEKVVRVFQAPRNFIENMGRICKIDVDSDAIKTAPEGASVPALGLSNKAVFQGESEVKKYEDRAVPLSQNDQYSEAYFAPFATSEPPTEENLLQNTLWPEVQKLYGHGYEIFAVAGHPEGTLLASSSKAAKLEHAAILLWDTSTWQQVCQLPAHSLTITQLLFSHHGDRLLSVSRDRTWSIFQHRSKDAPVADSLYERIAFSDKSTAVHSRIIWGCAWSHDDRYFVTVARDKKAVIWGECNQSVSDAKSGCLGNYRALSVLSDLTEPITAVDFAPVHVAKKEYLVAMGTESGAIHVYRWREPSEQDPAAWTKCVQLDCSQAHHLTVKRVKFCPIVGDPELKVKGQVPDERRLQLASCGMDHIVKIYSLDLDQL